MKPNKNILITAGILIILGTAISGISFKLYNVRTLSSAKRVNKEITEKITKLNIEADCNDIIIKPGNTDKITVSYFEDPKNTVEINTQNNTLTLLNKYYSDKKKWYDYIINFDFHSSQHYNIVITVPQDFSAESFINLKYGDTEIYSIKGSININSACGDVELADCEFTNLSCTLKYGDTEIKTVSTKNAEINCAYGDIDLENISGNITAFTKYGDIDAERIKSDNINLKSACGDIDCEIDGKREDYTITTSVNAGSTNIGQSGNGDKKLTAEVSLGDLYIDFIN